jgi:hypothetical protein
LSLLDGITTFSRSNMRRVEDRPKLVPLQTSLLTGINVQRELVQPEYPDSDQEEEDWQ